MSLSGPSLSPGLEAGVLVGGCRGETLPDSLRAMHVGFKPGWHWTSATNLAILHGGFFVHFGIVVLELYKAQMKG